MTQVKLRHSIERSMLVRTTGEDAAEPVLLFIHGLGESGLCFEGVLGHRALSSCRCLVPDLPGYGRSPWPAAPLTLRESAELLAEWLVERGDSDVVVVGHSMGGVVALLLAEAAPSLVGGVVNVDGNLSLSDCTYSSRAARQPLETFLGADGGFARLFDDIYRAGVDDEALRGYYVALRLADPRSYHAHSQELVALSGDEGLAARFAALPMPKTYIAGVPRGASARSLELLDAVGVEWRAIEPSGHWPFIDQPEAFVEALGAFVSSTPR